MDNALTDWLETTIREMFLSKEDPLKNGFIRDIVAALDALGDDVRMKIFFLLQKHGERTVTELCAAVHMTQPAVSHHLGILQRRGIVQCRHRGRNNFYSMKVDLQRSTMLLCGILSGDILQTIDHVEIPMPDDSSPSAPQ